MKRNLTQKILGDHLVEGELSPGAEIGLRIDHTLLQDATGTLAMLEFEALGLPAVKAELAAQYVDHNILHTDFKNADDHKFLQTACARYGIHFSGAGNGVSHQVHMERFGVPGKTLLGADSHTTGAAGVSMLGIGAGGLDVALAMAGFPYYLPCPRVLGVKLLGELPDWVSAKDVILEMLRRLNVKGCVGKIVEYYGPGVATLSATDRETIGNMGAELGATSSIFPSDERTREYLEAQGRGQAWRELSADEGAAYDEDLTLDLRPDRAAHRQAYLARQRRARARGGRHQGGPGDRGQQRQFLLPGPDGLGEDPGRQARPSHGLFPREPRQPSGARKHRPGKRDAGSSREPAPACMSPAASAASAWARPPGQAR